MIRFVVAIGATALGIAAIVAAASPLTACALPTLGTDSGAASSSGTTSTTDGGTSATGAGCGQDPATGITLCAAVSLCPNVVVDNDLYPNCGFRIRGHVIDLECLCNESLCPIGIASTCAQATQLLSGQNETTVCTQVNEGRCVDAKPPTSGGGGTSGNGNGSTCDKTCQSECGGDPGCIRICGC